MINNESKKSKANSGPRKTALTWMFQLPPRGGAKR